MGSFMPRPQPSHLEHPHCYCLMPLDAPQRTVSWCPECSGSKDRPLATAAQSQRCPGGKPRRRKRRTDVLQDHRLRSLSVSLTPPSACWAPRIGLWNPKSCILSVACSWITSSLMGSGGGSGSSEPAVIAICSRPWRFRGGGGWPEPPSEEPLPPDEQSWEAEGSARGRRLPPEPWFAMGSLRRKEECVGVGGGHR